MKKYKKVYLNHFDLVKDDFTYCEHHFIEYGAMIKGVDIHHILYKSQGGTDDINNLIGLCRDCHDQAHQELITKDCLLDNHLEFMSNNPY